MLKAVDLLHKYARLDIARFCAVVFGLQTVVAVLLLAILVPPFENSDEFNHFDRVDQIARGGLIAHRYAGPRTSGGLADPGIGAVDRIIGTIRFHPDMKVDCAMLRQAGAIGWTSPVPTTFANTAIYAPMLYAPAVAAVWIGKASHLSIVRTLMLARVTGGLSAAALATLAIALSGEAAPLLMVLLALPMSLSLFASVSQDGTMLAVAALAIGLLQRLRVLPPSNNGIAILSGLGVCLGLLVIGRPAYAPFSVVPLLLSQFSWRARVLVASSVVVALASWSVIVGMVTIINASADRGVAPGAQLHALLAMPINIVGLAVNTFAGRQGMEGQSFLHEMIGVLGWIDVVLPAWFYRVTIWVLLVAVASVMFRCGRLLDRAASGWLFLASLSASGLVFLLEYLTWSPVGFPFVDGVQGRYFLPIAMFLPGFLPTMRFLQPRAPILAITRCGLMLFPTFAITVTVLSVVRRYYV